MVKRQAETTLIYAHADTEMKRHALEKANIATTRSPLPTPLWHGREDIIQRLADSGVTPDYSDRR